MLEQRKKIIIAIVGLCLVLAVLFAAFAVYQQLSPMFRNPVAIVERDAHDQAELEKLKKQEKPQLTVLEEGQSVTTAMTEFNLKGISTQSAPSIPTAIYAQDKIDAAVDNILLVLDNKFYVLSYHTEYAEKTKLFTIDPLVLVPVQGYGWTSLAAGYEMGGLPCVVNTLNQAFALDINHYVFVNSEGLWQVSDQMGGLELELSTAEADQLNRWLGTAYTAGATVMWTGGLEAYTKLTVDGDAIEHWQRVCNAVIDKAKAENRRSQLMKAVSSNLSTNLTFSELKTIGGQMLQNQDLARYKIPMEGTYMLLEDKTVLDADLAANSKKLQKLIYQ